MKLRGICTVAGAALLSGTAAGDVTTYFASSGTTLYRVTGGGDDGPVNVETFELDFALNALSFGPDGRLFGTAKFDNDNDGFFDLCEILDPFGATTDVSLGDFLTGDTSSLALTPTGFLGLEKDNVQVIDIQPDAEAAPIEGALLTDALSTPGSSAFDAATGTHYGIKRDALYQITESGADFALNQIATLTGGVEGKIGGEWYDGQYYHAINDGEFFHIYTVNLETGELNEILRFETGERGAAGFAVALNPIPTPGAVSLLGAAGLCMTRRRR